MEFGRDVAKIAFCLGGMYCADLYDLKKEDYSDGVIHYNRAKTKHCRRDSAYMEMRVPDIIKPLFNKYKSSKKKVLYFALVSFIPQKIVSVPT